MSVTKKKLDVTQSVNVVEAADGIASTQSSGAGLQQAYQPSSFGGGTAGVVNSNTTNQPTSQQADKLITKGKILVLQILEVYLLIRFPCNLNRNKGKKR